MAIDWKAEIRPGVLVPLNLQEAARELNARLEKLEPKPAETKTGWKPAPPKA